MAELFGVSSDLLLGLPRKTLADPTETETFRELFRGFLAALTGRLGNRLTPDAAHILRDWVHTLWDGDREADELLSGLDVCEARHYTERGEYAQAAMLLRRAQEKKS